MSKFIEKELIEKFKKMEYFTREDLLNFFHYYEPDLKEGTFGWRIYDLKKKNIIKPLKRGLYTISYKPKYKPTLSEPLFRITKQITKRYEDVKFCIWESGWLNEFAQHQTSRSTIFIEIERGFEESVFYDIRDFTKNELYLNPHEREIDLYISESHKPIVIKKLVSRAPLSKRTERRITYYTPTLEKLLVDLYAEEKLFNYLQGSEMIHIYENALTKYTLNFTKLFSYAKRREKENDIKQFMINHMYHLVKEIIE